MSAYNDFMAHVRACPVCSPGPRFCEEGLRLGNVWEGSSDHQLDVMASGCWEPPIENYPPTEEEMDREFQKYDALPDDVKRL